MAKARMKTSGKIIIMALIMGVLIGGYVLGKPYLNSIAPGGDESSSSTGGLFSSNESSNEDCIRVMVVTWGGYAGGQYFNNGFKPNAESRFQKEYGICVEFMLNDDFTASRDAWKSGNTDLLWVTYDAFPTEAAALADFDPVLLFQADWSRGGDAIVVRRGINDVQQLRGKKVAVAEATPSHTFLLYLLDAAGIDQNEIQLVKTASAIDAAAMFKAKQVDAAVVWSPDDEDCVTSVKGAKVLTSTKKATHIIADGFFAKRAYVDANRGKLVKLIEGWMKGAQELNSSDEAVRKAAKILAKGLKQPEDFTYNAIKNVRLTTYGDNLNFFGINSEYTGVKGEDLYNKMGTVYTALKLTGGRVPNWKMVHDVSLLKEVNLPGDDAEHAITFKKATKKESNAKAFSSKPVKVTYPTGSSTLSGDAKYIIDEMFVSTALAFPTSRIRIEGNTDVTGSRSGNVSLSKRRAQSVKKYLINEHGIEANRIIIKGNGPDKPLCHSSSSSCHDKNRRTDFQLL